jgi:hypothetical protein
MVLITAARCRFASELAYHSHVAHSREPVLSEGPLCCALFGRDCKSTAGALTRSALTEIPSPPVSHRMFCRISKTRPLIGTSRRPSAVLLSGTKITRFCQSRFSIRIWKSSLSFLIPVSRIKMTMSRKSARVRGCQLQAKAPAISFLSASSSSRRCRLCSFII